jgi:hypothetical protein
MQAAGKTERPSRMQRIFRVPYSKCEDEGDSYKDANG